MCYNIILGGDYNFSNSMRGWIVCRPKSAIDKVIKIPREEYYKNKDLYVPTGHIRYYLEGPGSKKTKTIDKKATYKSKIKKLGKRLQKQNDEDKLYSRTIYYVNKNTLEIKKFIGHDCPENLYSIWFPVYFLDKVHNIFINSEYFNKLYSEYNNLEKIGKYTGVNRKNIKRIKDYYISLGLFNPDMTTKEKLKTSGFSKKCYVNKDGNFLVIDKSNLDNYLSLGYKKGKGTNLNKEDVLNYYCLGNSIKKTAKYFKTGFNTIKNLLNIEESSRIVIFNKDSKIIRLFVNDEIENRLKENGWMPGKKAKP